MTLSPADGATRRAMLAAGLAGGAGLCAPGAEAAPAALDLATPAGRLRAYMMMRGALDDRLVIGFVEGRYYGVVDAELTPLYGVVAATFARYRARPGGGYAGASYEVAFFTDLATGAALDTFLNPYTGERVDVVNSAFPPSTLAITDDLAITAPTGPPGLTLSDRVIAVQASGSDVWLTEQVSSAFTLPGAAKPVRYSEVTSLHALASDLSAPGAKSAPCQTAYTSIVSWRPWLKMGDHPGHLLGNGVGRYNATFETLPDAWRAAAAQRRPDVLKDPSAPLSGLLKD
jgi:hypothetical protein